MLDIDSNGVLLVKESNHLQPDQLVTFGVRDETLRTRDELFSNISPFAVDSKFEQKILQSKDASNECFHCHGLVSESAKSIIMFIHGGPHRFGLKLYHDEIPLIKQDFICQSYFTSIEQFENQESNMTNVFNAKIFGYLALGYDFIIPNYRGSVGFGADYVQQLPSHISEKDVSDCFTAMEYATSTKPYDFKYVMGGSHGGFLSG